MLATGGHTRLRFYPGARGGDAALREGQYRGAALGDFLKKECLTSPAGRAGNARTKEAS